jgi:hypothetical protein
MSMILGNLVQFKSLLLILTAAGGTAVGGAFTASYAISYYHQPPSFQFALNPARLTMLQNTTSTSTLTITSIGHYSGTVTLTLLFPGHVFTATLSPTRVNVHSNRAASSTLTVTAPAAPGNYTVLIIGAGSNRGRPLYSSAMLTVQIVSSQDFTISSSPNSIINTIGETNTTTITVTSLNGYTGNVSLTATVPFAHITVTGDQSPLTITPNDNATSALDITTTSNTAPGNYTITVTGTDGQRTHSTIILLQVVDPTPPPVVHESLSLYSYYTDNATTLTMILQDTGNTSITLESYSVQDQYGDAWTLTNWAGPTIPATNPTTPALLMIGYSCTSCTYTGITGLFTQFQSGHTYTVDLTTARNNEFSFTITIF